MSDPPPPKPKPGSLRDRIAAFEKSSSSSGPSNPSPPAPRPKPAGFSTWKPKAPSPPSSPSASGSVAGAGTGEGGDLGKSSTGMSVNDAKDSITKGSGSLKDRMAALQNKGAFGAPAPPLVAHKPLSERPKWKPPPQPVVAPSVDEERKEMGEELQKPGVVVSKLTDRKAGISAAVERSLSPPISVKSRESIEGAITLIPDNVDEAAAATGTRKSIDQDSQSKDEAITITTDGQQSGQPQEHSSGEQEQTIDPEDEERQRRARIAARMAKLGGARVGMAPPMFGVSGALGKKPVPTPARRSTLEGKRKSVDEAKEKEKGELDAKDIPLPTSPPLDSATSIDSDLGRSLLSDPLPTPSRKSSLLSPSSSSSLLTGSPLTGNESSVASGTGTITTETPMGTTKVPTSMPMSAVPRRAGPPRKKVVRPVVKEDEGVKEDNKEEENNGEVPKEKKEQGEIEQELKEQEQGEEEERDERPQEINAPEGESTSLLLGRFDELHTPIPIATATTVADTPTDVSTAILVGGVLVASPPSATTFTSSSTEPIPISHIFTSQNSSSTSSSIDTDLIPDAGGRRSPPPSLAISPEVGTGITPGQSVAGARMRVLSLDDGSESKSASLSQHVQHDRDQERERSGLGSLSSSETSMGVEEDEELRREEENIKDMRNMLDSMEEVNVQSIPVAIVGGGNEKEKDVHTSVAINEPDHARKEAIEELEEDDKEVEEEEVRKERVAERIAKMGGINPFSMGSKAPPSKKAIKDDDDDENQVEKQQEDPNANAHILPTVKRTSVQALSPGLRSLPPAVPLTSRPSYSHGLSFPPRAHGVPPAPPTRVEEQVQVEQEEDEDPREAFDDESDGSDYGDNDALGRGVGEEKMITTASLPRHAHVHPPRRIVPQTPVVMSDQEEEEEEEWQERVKGNEKGENRMDWEQDDDSEHTDEEADERMATSQLFVPPPGGRGSGPIVTQFQSNSQSEYHSQYRSNDNQGNDEDEDRSVPIPIPSRSRGHDFSDNDDGDDNDNDNDNDNEYGNGNESDHDGRALPVPPPPPPREGRRERMSAHAVPSAGTGELELEQGHGQLPTASPQFAICPPAPPAPEPEGEGESTQPYSAQSPASVPRASPQFAICPPAPPAEEDEFEDVGGYEEKSDNDDGEGDGEGKDEVLDEEEGDPIDPTFHAPSSRQGSYANLRGVAQGQDQDNGQGPTKRTFSPPSSPPPPPPASTRPISILGASRSQAASSQSSSSPSPAPPSRETRPMSVSMPPHLPASAHAPPVGSTIHVAPVHEIEEDKDKTSDVDSARRQTIAERMAKLGGIKFGAAPPIGIMGVRAPIRSTLGRRESEDVRREDEVTGGTEDYGSRLEDEGQTELERKERGAEGEAEAEAEGEENPRELTEEEEERARKERIAAKMAHMGGMRIGMLPPGAMGGFAPRTQSHVLREENLDRRKSLTTAAARESVAMARPPVPPPSRVPPPVESDSEDGVKIEAEAEVDEEDGYEEVLHDERASVRRYSDNDNKEQLKEEEETPPPLPSRTGRVVERQASADSYSTSTANTTTSAAAAGAPSRPPVPGGMRPPVPGGMRRSNTMQSQSESEKETSSKATLPSEYVMVDEPDHELHEEGPPPPPPPRPTGRTPERAVPSLPIGSASGTGSGDWELPSIPTSNEGDLDMSWTDAGSEPEPNAELTNPTISVPKPVTDSTSVPKPSPMDRHLTSDDLMSLWGRVGVQVCESATSLHEKAKKHPSTIVGDGSYAGFVRAALEIVPNAYVSPPPSSTSEQTWGYLIYQQTGPTVQKRLSEILPGDIIQFADARLKGHKGGMGLATYHQHVGNTENGGEVLVGVVGEFEERKRKVRVVHANQHVGGGGAMVDSVSYRLEDVKSGVVKVYRVLDA